ncbi:hypothetical protein CK218_29485 [Mesorhizobium sp. WSM3879]|nr:hypothetical protein CK218_29485 [Mesorhizobium sp. WSM3879]
MKPFMSALVVVDEVIEERHDGSDSRRPDSLQIWPGIRRLARLTPRESSSGGKQRLRSITKMSDGYLRTLLVLGAPAVICFARREGAAKTVWIRKLMEKSLRGSWRLGSPTRWRIAWALMTRGEIYRAIPA